MALLEERARDHLDVVEESRGQFDFDLCRRNELLSAKMTGKVKMPAAKKTGTTICGMVCKDGIVLGADTRATAGAIVADKNADKLHYVADNIYCAGAGTSADLTATTEKMEREMEIHRLNTGTQVRVVTVVKRLSKMLYQYQGHIGCHLVLGGVDLTGPHLYQISAHGNTDKLPYACMGSGMLAAMSVLEMRYEEGMSVEQGKELIADAISAGVFNDLGSGGNIDVCVITAEGAKHTRAYRSPIKRLYAADFKPFPKGATQLIAASEDHFRRHVNVVEGDEDGDVTMA